MKDFILRAALHALDLQLALQRVEGRTYKPEKHLLVYPDEFHDLYVSNQLTRTTNIGWFCFRATPLWIGEPK